MTAEEVFYDLSKKYGEDFSWRMIPLSDKSYVSELKREIGKNHFLYNKKIWAVAKCDFRDDVLFVTENNQKEDTYYLFHLTYSEKNLEGYPIFQELIGIDHVRNYIEKTYMENM